MENYQTCCRDYPQIALIQVNSDGKTTAFVPQESSLKFRVAACMLLQNGQVDPVVRKIVTDYKKHLQETEGAQEPPTSYSRRMENLRTVLTSHHADKDCACSQKIGELSESDGVPMTHQEYYQYVQDVRQRFSEATFECDNVAQALFPLLSQVKDYGDSYQLRARTLSAPEGGFVAYEYFDEDEDDIRIVCEGEATFPRHPGHELCHALLENDTLDEVKESLSEDNPARRMLQQILE